MTGPIVTPGCKPSPTFRALNAGKLEDPALIEKQSVVLNHLPARLLGINDIHAPRHADLSRKLDPCPLLLVAINRDAFQDLVDRADLIEQHAASFLSSAADRRLAVRGQPDRRMRRLYRTRLDHDVPELPILPLVGKTHAAAQRLAQERQRLLKSLGSFRRVHSKALELLRLVAFADPEIETAARQQIERRDGLGKERRIVPGKHDHGGPQADA